MLAHNVIEFLVINMRKSGWSEWKYRWWEKEKKREQKMLRKVKIGSIDENREEGK